MSIESISDERLAAVLAESSTQDAAAAKLGVARSTLKRALQRRGLIEVSPRHPAAALTREALHDAMLPPNNCRVASFREQLDSDSREVLDEALGYDRRDFPASRVREFLLAAGFREPDVPGVDAINAHRTGQRPCRCKG